MINPAPSHAEQLQLREVLLRAENKIATILEYFEKLTGLTIRAIEIARYPSGAYKPLIRIGGAVERRDPPPAA